ncbi:GcrA family cell cycle regulator [Breoghania sp. L-A4]|uniref:GcrA family cell cycle regulator n=1 Tax=Breoghania sp. L-A4 TaxID=2304600 RepID=UPI000E35C288|nr:GcrA family cell cycle regulator [Breoghania sp. L-A4]AXS39619.1 GcrA cell cycle regulator [Breoghania sp. L-A4]
MSWTTERVDLLKKLWAEGLSASQIAAELGGVTRNAVIGKVHRLGLSGRAKSTNTAAKPRRPRAAPATPARPTASQPRSVGATALKIEEAPAEAIETKPAPVHELVIPVEERASILQLNERTCKWPIGDPSTDDFYFCGRQSDSGAPYCAHHCRIAYQPANERRHKRAAARA